MASYSAPFVEYKGETRPKIKENAEGRRVVIERNLRTRGNEANPSGRQKAHKPRAGGTKRRTKPIRRESVMRCFIVEKNLSFLQSNSPFT